MRRLLSALLFSTTVLTSVAVPIGAVTTAASASSSLPVVSGGFGVTPKIKFPSASPPKTLDVITLKKGNGSTVSKGDLIVVNYLAQIWGGKVFDSSFSRGVPFGTPIGEGKVIVGWDKGLVGKQVGSRLLLLVPPADGYGKSGNSSAGITGTDTLAFVVDVIAVYNSKAHLPTDATPQKTSTKGPQVKGQIGTQPIVTIPKGTPQPKTSKLVILDLGHGAVIKPGLVIFQAVAVSWTGSVLESTWKESSPDAVDVGVKSDPTLLDPMVGKRLGSRVLLTVPANSSEGLPSYAAVFDVFAEYS